jgi:hypothetical protein
MVTVRNNPGQAGFLDIGIENANSEEQSSRGRDSTGAAEVVEGAI